jgi:cell division protein FtsN
LLAILMLAQAASSTPSPPNTPDAGPPPPSIVERIDAPIPVPTTVPTPIPSATPTARAAAPPAPRPRVAPGAAPAPAAPLPKVVPVAAPVPTALPVPAASPKASPAHGSNFGVHVSSFRKRATAEADARRLGTQLSLPARVLEVDLGGKGVWYRVVVGEVASVAEASALRLRLKEKGVPDGVVQIFRNER